MHKIFTILCYSKCVKSYKIVIHLLLIELTKTNSIAEFMSLVFFFFFSLSFLIYSNLDFYMGISVLSYLPTSVSVHVTKVL